MSANNLPAHSGARQLALLAEGKRAIAEAKSIEVAKELRDQAEAAAHYLRQHEDARDAAIDAQELKVRAERKLGELLAKTPKASAGRPGKNPSNDPRDFPSLADQDISYDESANWQKIASIPEETFEAHLAEAREGEKPAGATTAGVLRLAEGKREAPGAPRYIISDSVLGWLDLVHRKIAGIRHQYGNWGQASRNPQWDRHETLYIKQMLGALEQTIGELIKELK
jgi:hypothetical protein